MDYDKEKKWLTSKEAQKHVNIRACDLMHYRVSGKLTFQKKGRSFLYLIDDLDKLKNP